MAAENSLRARELSEKAAYAQASSEQQWTPLMACHDGSEENAKSAISIPLRYACSVLTEFTNETQDKKDPKQ